MFKSKHNFTCPDVIYLRTRQKKINRISLAVNGIFLLGMWATGTVMTAREKKAYDTTIPETPENNES